MCEEPMWGVVLELEVRIGLTVNAAAGTAAEGAGDGGGTAAASSEGEAQVELQEDVYGPFSGQVGDWGWGGRGWLMGAYASATQSSGFTIPPF